MLTALVRLSLRFRGIIIALACMLMIYTVYGLGHAKYDVFPEFAPPEASIQVEAPGLSPEQVELLVTQPIENVINGVPGIEAVHSTSNQGLSVTKVIFRYGSDIYRGRQLVAEKIAQITSQLPPGVRSPVITPMTSATSVVLVMGLTSPHKSLMDLRTVADWTLRPRLLAVPGVANAVVFGGEVRQLQIQVKPDRLVQYGLGIQDVITATQKATGIRGAGFLETENQRIVLQTEGQFNTPEQVAKTVILQQNGVPITLSQVAEVVDGPMPPFSAAAIQGKPGVLVEVSNQFGANLVEVTQGVEAALAEMRPALKQQGITLDTQLFRPANLIDTAIGNVQSALIIGGFLVVVVLFLFLYNFRTAAISCTAIPLSLLTAIAILQHMGMTINTMTLGGLAIALGEVVDDAVIDVENVLRRLRENRLLEQPQPVFQVILNASLEVRGAVVYATLAVLILFLPLLNLSGMVGRLFHPLGMAYILAISASLLVALTVTPALCYLLLGKADLREKESPFAHALKSRYTLLLQKVETHSRLVLGSVIGLTLCGLLLLSFIRGGFLPDLKEGHFLAFIQTAPGTSLKQSLHLGSTISRDLLKIPYVRSVAQRIGRAENAEDTWSPNYGEFDIDLKPLDAHQTVLADEEIRKVFDQYPFAHVEIMSYLTEHILESISGHRADVAVSIYGPDLDVLDHKALEVTRILNALPQAQDVKFESVPTNPQLSIRLHDTSLAQWGFNAVDVLDTIRTAYQGNVVSQASNGNQYFGVSVILDPAYRASLAQVSQLPLRNAAGTFVRLSQLATVEQKSGRYEIAHEGARRVQTILANVKNGDIQGFIQHARQTINTQVSLPPGTYIEFSGAGQAETQSKQELILYSLLAGIGIILLLSIIMASPQNLVLVLLNIPFALVGGILVVFFSGGALSIGSMVGFVTLFGITLRNSIMLMSHYEHLVKVEGQPWTVETAVLGASERFTPILMTALVTGLGLLPLALGSGAPGREIEGPLAMVILGGLMTSTALNLLILPTLALRYGRFGQEQPD
jgi:CzcA family heavy metal efflux pump